MSKDTACLLIPHNPPLSESGAPRSSPSRILSYPKPTSFDTRMQVLARRRSGGSRNWLVRVFAGDGKFANTVTRSPLNYTAKPGDLAEMAEKRDLHVVRRDGNSIQLTPFCKKTPVFLGPWLPEEA